MTMLREIVVLTELQLATLIKKAYDRGHSDGANGGYDNGYANGYEDGELTGYDIGYADAQAEYE